MNKVFIWIKENKQIPLDSNLTKYINKLEYLWSLYCEWFILDNHLKTNFRKALQSTCFNKQVIDNFSDERNWLTYVCNKLFWNEWLWKYIKNERKCYNLNQLLKSRENIYTKFNIPINFIN